MFHLNSVWRDSRYLFFLCLLLKFVTWLWWLLNLCFYLPLKSQCYIAQTIFEFLPNCIIHMVAFEFEKSTCFIILLPLRPPFMSHVQDKSDRISA
jgi:hypothetical protein